MTAISTKNKQKDSLFVDFDEFTTSSILEFLSKEQECFSNNNSNGNDDNSEIDVESIFEEINRLSDNTDERSVDEILREAEILISRQPQLNGCGGGVGKILTSNKIEKSDGIEFSQKDKNDFDKIADFVCPNSAISEESTPREMKNVDDGNMTNDKIEEITTDFETITLNIDEGPSNCKKFNDNDSSNYHNNNNNNNNIITTSSSNNIDRSDFNDYANNNDNPSIYDSDHDELILKNHDNNIKCSQDVPHHQNMILNKTFTRPNSTQSIYTEKSFYDNTTNPSPTHDSVTTKTSPIDSGYSITREHILRTEIEQLQEKLKDTEERLQSLRIQHDSLSQNHRDLRDNQTHVQEESDLLKLDVQHLTECANILRAELQSARNDRNEALEIQKILQDELNDSRIIQKKAQTQNEKDTKIIQDLQRQCKEMERILMRKYPDSVSALIVASKNPCKGIDDNSSSRRLLEQRIAQLEADAKEQDLKAQKILANVQARFNSVQSKYETHIADLETQVLSLQEINTKLNEKIESQMIIIHNNIKDKNNLVNNFTQTDDNIPERERTNKTSSSTISTQTDTKSISLLKQTPSRKLTNQLNKMSVSHSDSTISAYHAAAKEDAHLLATIRGMRVDLAIKDKAMQRLSREVDECKKTIKKLQKEKDAIKSEKPSSSCSTSRKVYDPSQFAEQTADTQALKEALNRIKLLEFDYRSLHDKRLQDLKTLQAAHERELASCHETVRILQQRLTERDEAYAVQKRRKVPIDYYALKAKVSSLERRHSEREQRLHMLVEALSKGRLNGALEEILTENVQ